MGISFWHLLVVLMVVLIVFGAGRLPQVMGDFGKGIRKFKEGINAADAPEESKSADAKFEEKKIDPPKAE